MKLDNGVTMSDHQVYMPSKNGPFRCDHCTHYAAASRCRQPDIVALLGAVSPGLAKVDPGGCSDYFHPQTPRSLAERMRG